MDLCEPDLRAIIDESRHAKNWGIEFGEPKIDLARLRSFKEGVVNKLTGGLGQISKLRKVQYIRGEASFDNSSTVRVAKNGAEEEKLTFDRVIIATGSRPASSSRSTFAGQRPRSCACCSSADRTLNP